MNGQSRKANRLVTFEYDTPGSYFITSCTHRRAPLFADESLRSLVVETWERLPGFRADVEIGDLVVMPDHVHGVIALVPTVGTSWSSMPRPDPESEGQLVPTEAPVHRRRHRGLPAVMQLFKRLSAQRVNQARGVRGSPVWQRSYWDRIPRSNRELAAIRQYICSNPVRAASDDDLKDEDDFWGRLISDRILLARPV